MRYCVTKTNAEPGSDTITFSITGQINLTSPLPGLTDDLVIAGPGDTLVRIDAGQTGRVLYLAAGITVEVSGVTLSGGSATKGGGIYNNGDLTLRNMTLTDNESEPIGGPAFGGGVYSVGKLLIDTSQIVGNRATAPDFYSFGAGIYNEGDLTVINSNVTGNENNGRRPYAGGIYNSNTASIRTSTISANTVVTPFDAPAYGAGLYNIGIATVHSSLIFRNFGSSGGDGYGGGVYNHQGQMTIIDTTITENVATGPNGEGGGLWNDGTLVIRHSTIAQNATHGAEAEGGGIYHEGLALAEMTNTIVADNVADWAGPDVHGSLSSSSYNLISDTSGGSTPWDATDLLNIDPLLGSLQDNGGPTRTMALLAGSPAIDAGGNTGAPPWDQRSVGFTRIVGGTVDIGAYEVQTGPAPGSKFAGGVTESVTPRRVLSAGSSVTLRESGRMLQEPTPAALDTPALGRVVHRLTGPMFVDPLLPWSVPSDDPLSR
jgi:hypothetical protein